MAKKRKLKNNSGSTKVWRGVSIPNGGEIELSHSEYELWSQDPVVSADVNDGYLIANDGDADLSTSDGYDYIGTIASADQVYYHYEQNSAVTSNNLQTAVTQISPYIESSSPTSTHDVDDGYICGARWINTTTKIQYICIDNAASAAVWEANANTSQHKFMQVDKYTETTATSYTKMFSFIFPGMNELNSVMDFSIISFKKDADNYDLRIYDITNTQIIGSITGLTNENTPEIKDITSLSNLPNARAIFELQAKRTGGQGSAKAVVEALVMKYT